MKCKDYYGEDNCDQEVWKEDLCIGHYAELLEERIMNLQKHNKQQAEQIERLVRLVKNVHKSKVLLMALDGNTCSKTAIRMITALWNEVKQVYKDYPDLKGTGQ